MAKKAGKRKAGPARRPQAAARKRTSSRRPAAGRRAAARASGRKSASRKAGSTRSAAARKSRKAATRKAASRKTASRKTASRKTASRKAAARKSPARNAASRKSTARKSAARTTTRTATARKASSRKTAARGGSGRTSRRAGGTGLERTLAQTPETGRTASGPTNPYPTKRSTGTPAGAGSSRRSPALQRERRQLREIEEGIPTPPSSLDMERQASAARTGRREMREDREEHTETSPVLTAGDVDADWEDAYAVGDEAPGGDNPTPDQDRVDDIGKALGVQYEDNEELKGADKIAERDRHRWELDPASADDYRDRE
jgi:hypothetical protein